MMFSIAVLLSRNSSENNKIMMLRRKGSNDDFSCFHCGSSGSMLRSGDAVKWEGSGSARQRCPPLFM